MPPPVPPPAHPRSLWWWLLLLLAPPVWGGETWGEVSMCPPHCVCRNLSESLSTLCVNKGLLSVPPHIDRRTVELRLADNYIPQLGGADFANMTGLVELTLSRNTLHRLRPLAFADLESLRSLHLDANRLTGLGPLDLAGPANLQHLTLNNNQLSAIAPQAFGHFLSSLEDLDLSYNNLREAPWAQLRSMAALHTLNLDHNLIESVPDGAFADLQQLGRLDVSSNRLRTLPGPAPGRLSFGGNPLHCNCQLLWLRGRSLQPDAMETCASPAPLAGRYFWAVPEAEFTCEPPLIVHTHTHTHALWALEGQRATLRCRALGDPPPQVRWVAPDERVLGNSSRVRAYGNGTLDVLVTRARDDGTYTCIAANAAGEASARVQLRIAPLPHRRGNRTGLPGHRHANRTDPREPSDISAAGRANGTGGEEPGRVGVQEVTATTAEVRWYLGGGASTDYLPWMYQIQYNSTADETLMYRILPPSSRGFQLRNLVSSADYRLCVVAVFEEVGVGSVTGARVLGCASFSTREDFLRCRTLHAHFLGGALSVLVGGAVVVMLLVITVATMVRHHQHQWACGRHDADEGRVSCRGRSRAGGGEGHAQGAESPLLIAKGTSVYSQTNGEGGVMMVVLPKDPDRPAARRIPPYSPESQRVTLYYPGPASCTLPRPHSPAPPAAPRTNRSCSFDMGEVATATRHGYGKRPGSVWSGRRPSLQSMLVPCTGPAHNTNRDELEESVV